MENAKKVILNVVTTMSILTVALSATPIVKADSISNEIKNPGFETGDFTGWKVTGNAFKVSNVKKYWNTYDFNQQGKYHVWGFGGSGDEGQGELKSSIFKLGGNGAITFRIGGGKDLDKLYVALVSANDDKEILKATGNNNEGYSTVCWDASSYIGQNLYIKVVDKTSNGFGHINVDDFHVYNVDEPITVPIGNYEKVAYWDFDEKNGLRAIDSITGTKDYIHYVFNSAVEKPSTDPKRVKGILNNALLFDGYSTWISRDAAEFKKPSDVITISAWVAPRTYEWGDLGQDSIIVNQQNKGKNQGFGLGIGRHGAWALQLGIKNGWFQVDANKDKPIPLNKWSYITAAYDMEKQEMKLYLNGELAGQKRVAIKGVINPSTEPLLIGKHNQPAIINETFTANMFDGLMDELKISYEPITDEQVKDQYNSYLTKLEGKIPAPNLQLDRSVYDGDMYRPQYHFIPPEHWMNEPHAPIYYNGQYHIFYQANPRGPYWHYISWGHAVSTDLVHWKDEPAALIPQANSVAPDGIWSGSSSYDENGKPVLFFTAGDDSRIPNQSIGLAAAADYSDPKLPNWQMRSPLVTVQEKDLAGQNKGESAIYGEFRDPFVFKEGAAWYMLVGSGIKKNEKKTGGAALLYTSKNLTDWNYKGPIFEGNHDKYNLDGTVWELPVLLPLKDSNGNNTGKHIMLVSPCYENAEERIAYQTKTVLYWVGKWNADTDRFIPDQEEPQMFDYGTHFSGPSGFVDAKGRSIVFSIAQDTRSEEDHYNAGWAHNAGLPVQLTYDKGKLRVNPITDELNSLHDKELVNLTDKNISQTNALLKDVKGDMLDILLDIEPKNATEFGIKVRKSPDSLEETVLYYDTKTNTFNVDNSKTSLNSNTDKEIHGGILQLDGQNLQLHIYIDRSMVEAYANGLKSITTRAYPVSYDALGIEIFGDGNPIVKSMKVYSMKSAYGDGTIVPVARKTEN
jgi:Beta-fructosidases (levanase/invertase)